MVNFFWSYESFVAFWLCFSRSMGFLINVPLFDEAAIPIVPKVLFSFLLSFLIFGWVEPFIVKDISLVGVQNFWSLTIYYGLSGAVISFMLKLIIDILLSAAHLATQQIGFSQMSIFDPTVQMTVSPIERLARLSFVALLISSGALTPIFQGLFYSFENFSFSQMSHWSSLGTFFTQLYRDLFVMALLLASPIIFCGIGFNLVLGLLARMVPQVNLLMMSFMMTILIGLLAFFIIYEDWMLHLQEQFFEFLGHWFQWIKN